MRRIVTVNRRNLLPALYFKHRGFFLIASGLAWVHLWGAFDELAPDAVQRHSIPIFSMHDRLLPDWAWGITHLLVAAALILGMVWPREDLFAVRIASAISATMFTLLCISFFISAIEAWPAASFLGPGVFGFAAIAACAIVLEPGINPANQRHRNGG